jgi:hypothetical protein
MTAPTKTRRPWSTERRIAHARRYGWEVYPLPPEPNGWPRWDGRTLCQLVGSPDVEWQQFGGVTLVRRVED